MFERFFIVGQPSYPLLWQQHDVGLVILSVLIDIGAAIVALHMAALARRSATALQRHLALGSGTLALGAGIWAMHFVAMLAFEVCAQGQFDLGITALSILPSLLASWVALHLLARPTVPVGTLLLSGLLVGAGIGMMHYIGMEAASVAPLLRYDPLWFAISVVVAVLLAVVALWIRFGLLLWHWHHPLLRIMVAGTVMGLAITGMHYTGMAAIRFIAPPLPAVASVPQPVSTGMVGAAGEIDTADAEAVPSLKLSTALAGETTDGLPPPPSPVSAEKAVSAAVIAPATPAASGGEARERLTLPLAIAAVTTALGLLLLTLNIGLRYRQMLVQTARSESLQRAVLETAVDGVIMIDARGIVQSFNPAAERIFGWQKDEVIGHNINMLMPEPYHSAHDGYLQRHLDTGHTSVIGQGREVEGVHKDGHHVSLRLAVGRVAQQGEPLFVGFLVDLTHYKALEHERQRGERQLRSLVGNLPGIAFRCHVPPDGAMVFVSEVVEQLTGWPAEAFLRQDIHLTQLIHPQDRDAVLSAIATALAQGQPYRVEYRLQTRSGAVRWMVEFGRNQQDMQGNWIDGVILDITDSKRRNAEFEGTVAALDRSEAIAEYDLEGHILRANQNFQMLLGYDEGEILSLTHAVLCTPEFAGSPDYPAFWQQLRAGNFQAGESLHLGKSGREVWVSATYNPIRDADGQVFRIMEFATDLSGRRAMEQDLRLAKERAEQAAAARAAFLANMSHEIRTPMNAIIGFTEVLLETSLDSNQRHQLNTVHQSAHSMLRLLNDILDTAKLEKGAVALEEADFSLRELCGQVMATFQANADKKRIAWVLDYPAEVADGWRGDAFRIQQILSNLLSNALKFTEQGQVVLRLAGGDGALEMSVQDSGIGMESAVLARIFDPFAQADVSTTRRYGGTGLGTTIVRQLVDLMQGQVTVQSQPGQGSTFTVHLPLSLASAAFVAQAPVQIQGMVQRAGQPGGGLAAPTALKALKVLAVDDVPTNLELLALLLQRDGHTVQQASSGAEAIEACARTRFDVVLMDLQMPGMDGLEATRRIRAAERDRQQAATPIIALSASVMEQDRYAAEAAGMNGFAGKPLEPPRLMAEIARVLRLQGRAVDGGDGGADGTNDAVHAAAAVTQSAKASATIDWPRGLRLWGQAAALRAAIEDFAHEADAEQAALRALLDADDWPAVAAQAHRLKGTAGNLALPQLLEVARQLEALARGVNPDREEGVALLERWAEHLAALSVTLSTSAAQTWAQTGDATEDKLAGRLAAAPLSTGMLDDEAAEAVRTALARMVPALAAGEYPQTDLVVLEKYLPAAALEGLQTALDHFDFTQASTELAALQTSFATLASALAPALALTPPLE